MATEGEYQSYRKVDKIDYSTTKMKYASGGTRTVQVSKNAVNLAFTGDNVILNSLKSTLKSVNLGSDVTQIPPSAFSGCENLGSVTSPRGCKIIGDFAFYGCSKLTTTSVLSGGYNTVRSIGNHAFDGCESIASVNIANERQDNAKYEIGNYAFANCKNLKSVTLGGGCSRLGERVFSGCSELTELSIPSNIMEISPHCLADIPNIETIKLPNDICCIVDGCFQNDLKLKDVQIGDLEGESSLEYVGDGVFSNCPKLTSITFPESITDMSCFDPNALRGSNVQRIVMRGMDDDKFVTTYEEGLEVDNTGYITTYDEYKEIEDNVISQHVPVVFICNNGMEGLGTRTIPIGDGDDTLGDLLIQDKWKNYVIEHLSAAYFVTGLRSYDKLLWVMGMATTSDDRYFNALGQTFARITLFRVFKIGTDRKTTKSSVRYKPRRHYKTGELEYSVDDLISDCEAIIGKGTHTKIKKTKPNDKLSKLGSSLKSIVFVSKQGNEYVFGETSLTGQTHNPQLIPVSRLVPYYENIKYIKTIDFMDQFRYGTWYSNADSTVRSFANTKNVPVFEIISSPRNFALETFDNMVFNNSKFQNWVASSKFLFLRHTNLTETKNGVKVSFLRSINEDAPNAPILVWYWKKPGDTTASVWEEKSYFFNPKDGEVPPYSVDDIIKMTDDYFNLYIEEPKFQKVVIEDVYTSDGRWVGYRHDNIGKNEVHFHIDRVDYITDYNCTLDIRGCSPLQRIAPNMIVDIPVGTYQYFAAPNSDRSYRTGIVFCVCQTSRGNTVTTLYKFINERTVHHVLKGIWGKTNVESPPIEDDAGNLIFRFPNDNDFSETRAEALQYGIPIVYYISSRNIFIKGDGIATDQSRKQSIDFEKKVINTDRFKLWQETKQVRFCKIFMNYSFSMDNDRENDYINGYIEYPTGWKVFKNIYLNKANGFPPWNETAPQFAILQTYLPCRVSNYNVPRPIATTYIPGNNDDVETVIATLEKHLDCAWPSVL